MIAIMHQNLRLDLLHGKDVQMLSSAWDALYRADSEAQFFLSRKFLEPILLRQPDTYAITVRNEGVLVGLLPIDVKTVWDRNRQFYRTDIKMAGSRDWADYNGILARDADALDVIDAICGFLKSQGWGRVRLKNLRMTDERRDRLLGHFAGEEFGVEFQERIINDGQTNNLLCPAIDLPESFDGYLDGLGRSTRQKIRRFLRKVENGDLSIRPGTPADIPAFERLWARQWSKKPRVEKRAAKYGSILATGFENDTVMMSVLEDGPASGPMGMIASFDDPERKTIRFFVSARDVENSSVPIGTILHADAIRSAIDSGYSCYDFLRGDEPYKLSLGAEISEISSPVLRRRSSVSEALFLSKLSIPALLKLLPDLTEMDDRSRAKTAARQLSRFWNTSLNL